MTDLDLIYGAGFVDDDIIIEALDYKRKRFSFAPVACAAAAAAVVLAVTLSLSEYLCSGHTFPMPSDSNTAPYSSDPNGTDISSPDTSTYVGINDDVVWGIGKTFDEVTARYGSVTAGGDGVYTFEKGYGKYVWSINGLGELGVWSSTGSGARELDREEEIEIIRNNGGCISISDISVMDLCIGDLSTLDLDNFVSKCGFEVVPLNTMPEGTGGLYDDRRFAYYTHPSYENMTFIMSYKTSGFDEEAVFSIKYETENAGDVRINDDAVWGFGKTFDELTARYGSVTSLSGGTCTFERGYGLYVWNVGISQETENREKMLELIRERGPCLTILDISAREFLGGDLSVLTLDNFDSMCGFKLAPLNPGGWRGVRDGRWNARYTHPSYKNIDFTINCKATEFDEEAYFSLRYRESENIEENPYEEKPYEERTYDERFMGFCPENPTTYGPPLTFDEVMSTLLPDPDYSEWEVESFCLVEVVRSLINEEYMQMNGYGNNEYEDEATVYEIKIVKDLISGDSPAEVTEPLYVKLSTGNGVHLQHRGDPTYAPGEKFTVVLAKQCEGYDFRLSLCDYALRFDLPDNEEVTKDDETTMLYYRSISNRPDTKIFDFAEDIEVTATASTLGNPLKYTQRVDMETLVNTLREDWRERGISVHYE